MLEGATLRGINFIILFSFNVSTKSVLKQSAWKDRMYTHQDMSANTWWPLGEQRFTASVQS